MAGAVTPMTAIEAPLPSNTVGAHEAILNGVSCNSPTQCVAVGHYESSSGGQAFIVVKNSSWGAPRPAFLPPDALPAANGTLNSVSCQSFGNCVAVGQYATANGYQGFIVTEKAGVWSQGVRAPLPGDAVDSSITSLYSVSCVTITTCVAVGQYKNGSTVHDNQGLIVWESAGHWTKAMTAPLPAKAKANFITQLDGISCPSWGNCVAVGQYVNTNPARRPMILTESGGVWVSSVTARLPLDSHYNPWAGLFSVKCTGIGNCVAVGVYQGAHGGQGLIIGSINGQWGRGIVAPLPSGYSYAVNSAQLLSVSCIGLGYCQAVGFFTAGQINRGITISERHGGWGNSTLTPHPANAVAPYYEGLNAVSCNTIQVHCSMVGQYQALVGQPAHIVSN
jgi:hypothetical protein